MGKQDGCLQPEGKEVQAWDSVGQPAVEMAKCSGKAERPIKTKVFVPLVMTVASATEAYQAKLVLRLWTSFLPHPCLGRPGGVVEFSLHLALLTLTPHRPQQEP